MFIARGFVTENGEKRSDLTISDDENGHKPSEKPSNLTENDDGKSQKQPNLSVSEFPTMLTWNVYHAIKLNRKAKYSWLADNLGVSERTIQRAIDDLNSTRSTQRLKVSGSC